MSDTNTSSQTVVGGVKSDNHPPSRSPSGRSSASVGRDTGRSHAEGTFHITATYNNLQSCFVDNAGNTVAWASAGEDNRGAKRATPYAAAGVAKKLVGRLKEKLPKLQRAKAIVRGAGQGSIDACLKELHRHYDLCSLENRTPLPHNGCRPPKEKRN